MKVATCQLLTGQDDECQLGHSQLRKVNQTRQTVQTWTHMGGDKKNEPTTPPPFFPTLTIQPTTPQYQDLVKFRLFLPELILRWRLAADFSPPVRVACYWLMACALLEIILFLAAATAVQWRRLRQKGLGDAAIWEQEALVWAFLLGWHELLSYLYVWWFDCGMTGEQASVYVTTYLPACLYTCGTHPIRSHHHHNPTNLPNSDVKQGALPLLGLPYALRRERALLSRCHDLVHDGPGACVLSSVLYICNYRLHLPHQPQTPKTKTKKITHTHNHKKNTKQP